MESDINKDFIFNHFARQTSPLQRELIAQWLRDKANEEAYYEWLEEWENKQPQYIANTELAYQRYSDFIEQNPNHEAGTQSSTFLPGKQNWFKQSWLIAASILLLLCSGAFLGRNQFLYQTYETAFGETQSVQLPDGSQVVLNANSRLLVPRWGFGRSIREVKLSGEANFDVTHTPTHQKFIVKTINNLNVIVLGTNFTVFSRKRGIRVSLNKGQIKLQYQEGTTARQLLMKPGQLATFDPQNHIALHTSKQPEQQPVWSGKRFVFNETPLQEVAYMLEENYGLQVEIRDPELARRVLIGSIGAESADQLLQSISELLDINVIRQGNRVQLMSH